LRASFTAKSLFLNRTAETDKCAEILDGIIETVLNVNEIQEPVSPTTSIVSNNSSFTARLIFFCLKALKHHRIGRGPITIFERLYVFF
jgi:hypothetical protein